MTDFYKINEIVESSAGCGKTYSLIQNYLAALKGNIEGKKALKPQEILALTFTKKAALEMRSRIIKELAQDSKYEKVLYSVQAASIETFHSFGLSIIKEYGYVLRISHDVNIMSAYEEERLSRNILQNLIIDNLQKNNHMMSELINNFKLGSSLREFGIYELVRSCHNQLREWGINENFLMQKRSKPSKGLLTDLLLELKNSFYNFKESSKQSDKILLIENNLNKLNEEIIFNEQYLAKELLLLQENIKGNFGNKECRQNFVSLFYDFVGTVVDYYNFDLSVYFLNLVSDFAKQIDEEKIKIKSISFSDIIVKCLEIFNKEPTILQKVANKYKHILIDEYQDTNPCQEKFLIALLSLDSSVFVVGDKKQSIYGFRGAHTKALFKMHEYLLNRSANTNSFAKRMLSINRRSDDNICKFVNLVSTNTLQRQFYDSEEDLIPLSDDNSGRVTFVVSDEQKQGKRVLHSVLNILSTNKRILLSDIAILVRRVSAGEEIEKQLLSNNIDCKFLGKSGFFDAQEIGELISLLSLLVIENPTGIITVLASPLVRISQDKICEILLSAKEIKLDLDFLTSFISDKKDDEYVRLKYFLTVLNDAKAILQNQGALFALDHVLLKTNYYSFINDELKQSQIRKLRYFLQDNDKPARALIIDMYIRCLMDKNEPLAKANLVDNAVQIMTIHQSKGLEFPIVILADIDSTLPSSSLPWQMDMDRGFAIARQKSLLEKVVKNSTKPLDNVFFSIKSCKKEEEELELRRLLYVALTRAKNEIFISVELEKFLKADLKEKSMLDLILNSVENYGDNNFFNIKFLSQNFFYDYKKLENKEEQKFLNSYKHITGPLRLFSSELDFDFVVPKRFTMHSYGFFDGDLAHKVLRHLLESFSSIKKFDKKMALLLATSFLRAKNSFTEKDFKLISACIVTAENVFNFCQENGYKIIFENPISASIDRTVIEGFIDIKLENQNSVVIIELKSSLNLAHSPKSYLQSYAYCLGQKQLNSSKDIFYEVRLIGSDETICPTKFGTLEEETLRKAVLNKTTQG